MKKKYETPLMTDETLETGIVLGPIIQPISNPNPDLGNERNSVFDDEPAASGDEGGYKRTLW